MTEIDRLKNKLDKLLEEAIGRERARKESGLSEGMFIIEFGGGIYVIYNVNCDSDKDWYAECVGITDSRKIYVTKEDNFIILDHSEALEIAKELMK